MQPFSSLRKIFIQYSNHHYNAIIKGESYVITSCGKPTEEAEDHAEVKVTTKNPEIKSGKPFNMAIYENMSLEAVKRGPMTLMV